MPIRLYRPLQRVLWLFIVPNALFAILAIAVPEKTLILAFNGMLAALSVGVCVAYGPLVIHILTRPEPIDRADLLAVGIFCSWFASVMFRSWSLYLRYGPTAGQLLSNDFLSYALFLSICAALMHLLAPGALKDRVPTRRWIQIGFVACVGVFAILALGWWFGY